MIIYNSINYRFLTCISNIFHHQLISEKKKVLTTRQISFIEFCIQYSIIVNHPITQAAISTKMKKTIITSENLDQKAYQIIKDMIENRELPPGQKIPQEKLAAELGISRTPLISALKFLEQEKLVETKPRRGFFVRSFSMEELISIFEIREVLEGLSARRAAHSISDSQKIQLKKIFAPFTDLADITDYHAYSRADRKFHNYLAQISSREFLSSILQTFNIVSLAYQYPTREGLIRSPNETITEHISIIEAICSQDPKAAEQRMRQHLQSTSAILEKQIKSINSNKPKPKEVKRKKSHTDVSNTLSH
jgi:DNA-binding GntR family transcriptional regulator